MTFFLRSDNQATPIQPGPDFEPQSWFTGMSATAEKTMLERDANMRLARERTDEAARLTQEVMPLLDSAALLDRLKQKGIVPEVQEAITPDALRYNNRAQAEILAMAREEAEAMPVGKWNGVDLSEEGVDARVNARLRAEYADLEAAIAMSPVGTVGSFAAQLAGGVLDVRNLAVITPGVGGPTVMAAILRGASVNAAAEAAFLPSQFEMADRLNIQAPDVLSTLAMAAAGGAILDGGITAAGKAIGYFAGRNAVPDLPDVEPVRAAAAVEAAEEALMSGRSVEEAVEGVMAPEPVEAPVAPAPEAVEREPLVPAEPVADPFERIAAPASQEEIAAAQAALDEARAVDFRVSRPLANYFRKRGGIDPDSPLGQELKARGVSSKTLPGLSKRTGAKSLDGLPAREMEEDFPGITEAAGLDDTGMYLDQNGLLELLIDSAQGGSHAWLRTRADADAALNALLDAENPNRTISALEQFQAKERADDGFFVDLNNYEFDDPDGVQIERRFDQWSARRGFDAALTPDERAEILTELRQRGGDAEYLVERAFERSIREGSDEAGRGSAAAGTDPASGQGAGVPWDNPGNAGQGRAGAGGDAIASEAADTKPAGPISTADIIDGARAVESDFGGDVSAYIKSLGGKAEWEQRTAADRAEALALNEKKMALLYALGGQDTLHRVMGSKLTPEKGGVNVIGNVAPWAAQFVEELRKAFGLEQDALSLIDLDFAKKNKAKMAGDGFNAIAELQSKPRAIFTVDGDLDKPNQWSIGMRPNLPKTIANMETLAHEFGHLVQLRLFSELPLNERAEVLASYGNWVVANVRKGAVGKRAARSPARLMRAELRSVGHTSAEALDRATAFKLDTNYAVSFREYFADMVARHITTSEVGTSFVDRFFGRIADMWRKIAGALKRQGYSDNAVSKWLDGLMAQRGVKTERTAAGEQTLIPGVAPVAPRLEKPAPVRGPQEPDSQIGGMFDQEAVAMRDMFDPVTAEALTLRSKVFDDPTSTEAQAFLDSMVRDLQDETDLDVEGMGLVTDEGTPITTMEALLREIEENDTLAREIELCRTGAPNDPQ